MGKVFLNPKELLLERVEQEINSLVKVQEFTKDMDHEALEEMNLLRPVKYMLDPDIGSIIPPGVLTRLFDFGDAINVIPGVWWIDGGKKKFTINPILPHDPPLISGTLDDVPWNGLLELISLFP